MGRRLLFQTEFDAIDGMSGPIKKMNRGFGRFAANITDKNSAMGRSFGSVNRAINRGLMVGMVALAGSVALAAREYVKFENSIVQGAAKFADIEIGTQSYINILSDLKEETRRVASISEFSATQLAGAADKFAMSGVRSDQTLKLLAGTTDLATAANVDLVTAVDIATDSLGAFDKMTSDTIQLEKNLINISDQMAKTTTTSNTSLTELFEAVGNGARTFTDAGQSMATFNTLAGTMAQATIKGGEAGTALRNVMLRLSKPSAEAAAQMEKMGVTVADQDGNFKDIVDIIAQFEKGLIGMGTAQRTGALGTIFGAKTVNSFNVLLGAGSEQLREYRTQIENSQGAAKQMAEAMRDSLAVQIEVLKSGLIELGFQFVEAFEKDGRGALKGMIDFVQQVDISQLIDFAVVIADVFKFIGNNWEILLALTVGIKGVSIAIAAMTLATKLFGITLAATPVGIILVSIGLLVTALTLLITKWEDVKAAFSVGGSLGEVQSRDTEKQRAITSGRSRVTPEQLVRTNRSVSGRTRGQVETPTPSVAPGQAGPGFGSLDININNGSEDRVDVKQSREMPQGTNINFTPQFAF